jgi:acylphosphatase/predicted MFS family arabinose efflux permease
MAGLGDLRGMDSLGRARAGTWTAFGVTGVVTATYASRIPAVQDRLGLTPAGLAVAVLAIEGGAVLGLPLGGAVVTRRGSRRSLRLAFSVYVPGLLAVALAPTLALLAVALLVWAAANSVADVALNAQGVELERRYGRPVLSSLHAGQSVGLLGGALAATAAAGSGLRLPVHVAVVATVCLVAAFAATAPFVREAGVDSPARLLARPERRLVLIGSVAFCAFLVDGAATNWIAVHLRDRHAAGEGAAAAGYLLFAAGLVVGRLCGDRLTAHLTRARLVQACGAMAAVGTAVAVTAPGLTLAVAGWALVGLAVAPLAPVVLGAAPGAGRVPAPAAVAAVSTLGYLGSFSGPPLVGVVAQHASLSGALGLVVVAGVAATVLAGPALGGRGHYRGVVPVVRRRVLVSGRVQAVFYQDTCRRLAQRQGVAGWVRNLPDGRVEAAFEGAPAAVAAMVRWASQGPEHAAVTRVEEHEEPPEDLRSFEIR